MKTMQAMKLAGPMRAPKTMKDVHIRAALKRALCAFYGGDSEALVVEPRLREKATELSPAWWGIELAGAGTRWTNFIRDDSHG
jgi:hypothetical protein